MIPPGELDGMTDGEFRHTVVNALDRIEVSIRGDGTEANPGLCGVVQNLKDRVDYNEVVTIKKEIKPRIDKLETNHQVHMAKIAGKNQALTLLLGLLSGAAAMFGIITAL